MKKIFAAACTVLFVSTLFFGCGLVDDNPGATRVDDEPQIESTYNGMYMTTIDTTGYDDPG